MSRQLWQAEAGILQLALELPDEDETIMLPRIDIRRPGEWGIGLPLTRPMVIDLLESLTTALREMTR